MKSEAKKHLFNVAVGRTTRSGNLEEIHSFVCETNEPNISVVWNYFKDKYKGLSVVVKPIEEFEILDFPEKKPSKLRTVDFDRVLIDSYLKYKDFPEDLKSFAKELIEDKKRLRDKTEILKRKLFEYIDEQTKFIGDYERTNYGIDDLETFRFTLKLKGNISEADEVIANLLKPKKT
jgi:hypothetical protein